MVADYMNDAVRGGEFDSKAAAHAAPANNLLPRLMLAIRTYPGSLVVVGAIVLVASLFVLSHLPKSYTASALITPPSELDRLNVQSGLSGGTGGGLAGLAGISMGPQSASQVRYETFVTLLTSRRIAAAMIRDHDALHIIYAASWDSEKKSWKRPSGILARARDWLAGLLGFPGWSPPDADKLASFMNGHLKVNQSLKTSQRTLSLTAKTPELASNVLTWALEEADAAVRADALARANDQLRYLNAELAKNVANSENRVILSEIQMGTERSVVLASTGSTFAEQIIQPPETSNIPTSPKFIQSILACLAISLAAGIGAAFLRLRLRGNG